MGSRESKSALPSIPDYVPVAPFKYEQVETKDGVHFRISDANDNALCFCYYESNANVVVTALNRGPK